MPLLASKATDKPLLVAPLPPLLFFYSFFLCFFLFPVLALTDYLTTTSLSYPFLRCGVGQHKIALAPRDGTYEAMSGDAPLNFVRTVLEEQWHLEPHLSIDARTALVREEVQKLASPFALSYIGLLEYVLPGLQLNAGDLEASLPPGSA